DAGIPACGFPPLITATWLPQSSGASVPLTPCHPSWETVTVHDFHPDLVFWIVVDAPEPWHYQGRRLKPCEEPYDSLYQQSLRNEIARLGASGTTVVVTTQAYDRFFRDAVPDRTVDCNNRLRREVAAETGARLVDLFNFVCPKGRCRVKQSGATLRPDGLHYEGPGGDIVAKWLIDQARSTN
ncbi:MAG TPA: hypothetical protein VIK61_15135, partial [Acidimicrobiia bacterium]